MFTQALTVLNHMGVCVSYNSTWNYIRRLTTEAKLTEQIKNGRWIWVYDNVNIHTTIRHEREGK